MASPRLRLFPLPGPNERRTLVPQFLVHGADQVPQTWQKDEAAQHACKRLATIVPTLSFAAWLKSVDVVHSETIRVTGATLQDQQGSRGNPALHVGWGTPRLNGEELWNFALNQLPTVDRPGHRVSLEPAKWSARTEIGPWGANYGDSRVEEAGKAGRTRPSVVRYSLAEAIRHVIQNQPTGQRPMPR